MENAIVSEALDAALQAAESGFWVFPLRPNSKLPAIKDFANKCTRDVNTIIRWWDVNPSFNIGIYCGKFGDDGESLVAIDVDNKGEKKGSDEIFRLECDGYELPNTYLQRTPTGGIHYVYRSRASIGNSCQKLGPGIDSRGVGGYFVGARSSIAGGFYTASPHDIAECPEWVAQRLRGSPQPEPAKTRTIDERVDSASANARASHYLRDEAPPALEGKAGDHTTFRVACTVKDFGVTEAECKSLMSEFWNPRCEPLWALDELETKITNAYRYGKEAPGTRAPEVEFADTRPKAQPAEALKNPHPILKLNENYAFLATGQGHVICETKNPDGRFFLKHHSLAGFHAKFANKTLSLGNGKTHPISELWMKDPGRREYEAVCFKPGLEVAKEFYNLWRGFAVEPLALDEAPNAVQKCAVDMFLAHARENVCSGNEELYHWLIAYFAHLIQKPWEKPLTALVMKGKKGTGKNALIDRIGYLLGDHYRLVSNRRYLTGNFNSHMENCLFITLDEAYWSGDKQGEGPLKDLITGATHMIERKGMEPYPVANCTRVCILGNEEWLVPATADERRYAVFTVGERRKQDTEYFQTMHDGLKAGGYRYLLRYLMDFDCSKINLNVAPKTKELLEQKFESLDPFFTWWYECLTIGGIARADFGGDSWPQYVAVEDFRNAFERDVKSRRADRWTPNTRKIGKMLRGCLPELTTTQKRTVEGERSRFYVLPSLHDCRKAWENYIGHVCMWED